ncbi:2'-5' RNA ligase family protein [Dactylosporangium cerinum]|uniref:2'-5' RNA ligase family protein n=1 Tax=Dactylosporangium cerinum TaxID=1434730 RepID=A0ABV9WFF7_9ACTN
MTTAERESLDTRWRAYRNLPALRNHWYWRPGWSPERRFYTWHITFAGQTALEQLVSDVQRHLRRPGLDLVPLEGLHLTAQGVGFTDEVSDGDLAAIIKGVTEQCARLRPFDLSLGPLDPDAEGIGLLIQPWAPVIDLRSAIRSGIAQVWPVVPEPADGFRPHVTVAYSGADVPPNDAITAIEPLREREPAIVRIAAVQLITLRRADRAYVWETVHTAPLGACA